MRKKFKQFSKATYLHHLAAYIQNKRRELLRRLNLGTVDFQLNTEVAFKIDIAARTPFKMFTEQDPDMQLEMNRFLEITKGKKCFLDVGSLYGIFSLVFCSINPDSPAYAIEPSPKGYDILQRNSTINTSMNIHSYSQAFGSMEGELKMHYEWVHLIANHLPNQLQIVSPMTTLDNFIASKAIVPDVIKIDVDGYEGDVIQGGYKFLSEHDPIIFLELHGEWIKRYGHSPSTIHDDLKKWGYQFLNLDLKLLKDSKTEFETFAQRIICTKHPELLAS